MAPCGNSTTTCLPTVGSQSSGGGQTVTLKPPLRNIGHENAYDANPMAMTDFPVRLIPVSSFHNVFPSSLLISVLQSRIGTPPPCFARMPQFTRVHRKGGDMIYMVAPPF